MKPINIAEMPLYNCHKQVRALKIATIQPSKMPEFLGAVCKGSFALGSACGSCARCEWYRAKGSDRLGAVIVPADEVFAPFSVDSDYLAKHKPEPGGYFVVYKDGYQSFSPAEAFEDGYTRA
jgi:hypothetical protein